MILNFTDSFDPKLSQSLNDAIKRFGSAEFIFLNKKLSLIKAAPGTERVSGVAHAPSAELVLESWSERQVASYGLAESQAMEH